MPPMGNTEGLREGLREGRARMQRRQMERRFGPVSESVHTGVSAAGLDALEQWLDRVLDAPTLDAVFDDDRTH